MPGSLLRNLLVLLPEMPSKVHVNSVSVASVMVAMAQASIVSVSATSSFSASILSPGLRVVFHSGLM